MTLRTRRVGVRERMDDPGVDRAQLNRSLADLRAINRWLGGTGTIIRHLEGLLDSLRPARYRVLDVATGSADIPLALARWGRARGIPLEILATDAHARTLDAARERTMRDPDVRVEEADALDLPYGDGSFHFALCSTALHHFDRDDAVRVLRELRRVASCGVVVHDLRRSRFALWGAKLLAATLWRTHPVTRHDGPLSIRRAFTPAELREVAAAAGYVGCHIHEHLGFRLSLVLDRTAETGCR